MKHLKTYENFDYEYFLNKYGKEYADYMMNSSYMKNKTKKEKRKITLGNISKEDIEYIIDTGDYRDGDTDYEDNVEDIIQIVEYLKKQPQKITLYRALQVDDIKNINKENLGNHYVIDKWMINGDLLLSAGIEEDEDTNIYVVTVKVDKNWINIEYTIKTNYLFNTEREITLKDNSNINIIDITKYEDFDNSLY